MGREKLVDTWFYDVKDLSVPADDDRDVDEDAPPLPPKPPKVINKKVEVKVFLEKKTADENEPPYALREVNFIVRCKEPKFDFDGTDIECLRLAAWAELDTAFEIKWENYYLVKVEPVRIFEGSGSGVSFSYDFVYRGTTWNGKLLMKHYAYRGQQKISPWPGRFTDKSGTIMACIPASDTNRSALEEFGRRVDKLREMMRDTLRPEQIMQTLANLSALKLLPNENPDEKD